MVEQPELIGGFVLKVGDIEEDNSIRGRLNRLEKKPNMEVITWVPLIRKKLISILKTEIENYDTVCKDQEVGTVIWVGDGIATVY